MLNPYMPDEVTLFADEVMKRFLIGAVARAFEPGCTHDWMPIFVGAQNLGKTTSSNTSPRLAPRTLVTTPG